MKGGLFTLIGCPETQHHLKAWKLSDYTLVQRKTRRKKEGVVGERERGSEPRILKTNMPLAVKKHLRREQAA